MPLTLPTEYRKRKPPILKIILSLLLTPRLAFGEAPCKQGTFWEITAVEVHPGKLDAYIENLNNLWRKQRTVADGEHGGEFLAVGGIHVVTASPRV